MRVSIVKGLGCIYGKDLILYDTLYKNKIIVFILLSCGADIIRTLAKINTYLRTSTIPQMISYGFPIGQGNILDIFVLMYYISMKPVGIFRIKKYLICICPMPLCGDFN